MKNSFGCPGSNLTILLTILVHGALKASLQPACPALVPVGLVNWAATLEVPLGLAGVDTTAMDAALEES